LVGNRQDGREVDEHVMPVPPLASEIVEALQKQLLHGRYPPSTLYGDGHVSERIAEALVRLKPYVQKHLYYIYDGENGKPVLWDTANSGLREGALHERANMSDQMHLRRNRRISPGTHEQKPSPSNK
jgi:hypothetical protein